MSEGVQLTMDIFTLDPTGLSPGKAAYIGVEVRLRKAP